MNYLKMIKKSDILEKIYQCIATDADKMAIMLVGALNSQKKKLNASFVWEIMLENIAQILCVLNATLLVTE